MDYLAPPDLKVCRLVCKQWDEELSRLLRKVSYLPLFNNRRLQEFLEADIMNHTFCSNYQVGPEVTMNLREEGSLVQKFFTIYGPFIRYCNNCSKKVKNLDCFKLYIGIIMYNSEIND